MATWPVTSRVVKFQLLPMNQNQFAVVCCLGLILAALQLFPPWAYREHAGGEGKVIDFTTGAAVAPVTRERVGHHFRFKPPEPGVIVEMNPPRRLCVAIDTPLLVAESAAVLAAGLLLLMAFRSKKSYRSDAD